MPDRARQTGWPPTAMLRQRLLVAAVVLLLVAQTVSGQIQISSWNSATQQTTNWVWSTPTLTADPSVTVRRGDSATITYTASASATPTCTAVIEGTIDVNPNGASCNTAAVANTFLRQIQITAPGAAANIPAIPVGRNCASPGCQQIAFGPINVPCTATTVTVAALWDPAPSTSPGQGAPTQDPLCPAATIPIQWAAAIQNNNAASIGQVPATPPWATFAMGTWLVGTPTMTMNLVSGGPVPPTTGTTTVTIPATTATAAGVEPAPFTWTAEWTLTYNGIVYCITQGTQAGNVVNLTPVSSANNQQQQAALSSANTQTTITVQGCDQALGISMGDLELQTQLTFAWTHSIQTTGPSSVSVPWGQGATVPVRASFQRTVTNAVFLIQGTVTLTNPENGPVYVQALQIQCPWTTTIVLQCGVNTLNLGSIGGSGTGFVIPASGTYNCPINQQVPGVWGADMTQPCTVYTQTIWNVNSQMTGLILNFAAPRRWVRLNDCVQWSMQCSAASGAVNWRPNIAGGPQGAGTRICGNDNQAPIPDQDASIAISGGWIGDGTAPSDCTSPVTTSCTSTLSMQNTGATTIAQSGGGTTQNLQIQAAPINCPSPPPSPSPSPSPIPDLGPGFLGNNRMVPVIAVAVTKTYIQGTFGWNVAASVAPASQAIVLGSTGTGKYTVTVTRGNANDAQPVKYIIEGTITLRNPFNKVLPLAGVNAVIGDAKVAADCPDLPAGLGVGQTKTCTYRVLYSLGPAPGQMDAEAVFPDTPTTASAESQAPFSFDRADTSQATGQCGFVMMSFAANEGMGLTKLQDAGSTALRVDGQPVRVCSTTPFQFDVQFAPNLPLACRPQPVIGTATVYPDVPEQTPIKEAAAAANISVTCAGSFLVDGGTDSPADDNTGNSDGGSAPAPAVGGVTVTLGDVTSRAVQNVAWSLRLQPDALGGKVSKPVDGSAELKFRVIYSKSIEQMTGYNGELTIRNTADQAIQVDSIVIELTDSDSTTVAQVAGNCSNREASQINTLTVPAQSSLVCSYELKARVGGTVQATITVVDVADPVQSQSRSVQSLMDAGAAEGCANLLTGLGATQLVPDGRVLAGGLTDRVLVTEVCNTGMMDVVYAVPATDAPCGTYPFVALAGIVPSAGTTTTPITASASVDVTLTGCDSRQAPLTAQLNVVRSYKARIFQWSIRKQLAEALPDNTYEFEEGQRNVVNARVLFTRTLQPGQKVSVAGQAVVQTGSTDRPVFGKSRLLILPLCADDICAATFATPSCDPTVKDGSFSCRFQADRLPVASGVVLPLFYSSADQTWPHIAKAVVYDPNNSSGRRTLGRCATLTDTEQISGGPADTTSATVTKVDEVNSPPSTPVCASSFLYTYGLEFGSVQCGGVPYELSSQARAVPSEAASGVASASLSFTIKC